MRCKILSTTPFAHPRPCILCLLYKNQFLSARSVQLSLRASPSSINPTLVVILLHWPNVCCVFTYERVMQRMSFSVSLSLYIPLIRYIHSLVFVIVYVHNLHALTCAHILSTNIELCIKTLEKRNFN